jgi:RimJ/RimL family protein N-acetyltransferase
LGHCETASLIGEASLRGQGLGQEAAHLRAYYAFDIVGLRVLYSEHYPYNTATQRMMEALGAHVWGIKPEANFKNGRYTDVVCTFLRRDMWRRPDWLPELI